MVTFRAAAAAYITVHEAEWRNAVHRRQWTTTLETYVYPHMGAVPVADVDVPHVLEPIWRKTPETASRVRGRMEVILNYARVRKWRSGENPARWRGHLAQLLPARAKVAPVEHHAALPWWEIGKFMASLADVDGVAAHALRFAILTAARTGDVIGATWGEINLPMRVWIVPAIRMKAKREHRVPLSAPALAIVAEMAKLRTSDDPSAPLFPGAYGKRGLSNMALLMTLRRMGRNDLTAHGFRSTFKDWAAETTAHPGEVSEMALAHAVAEKVEGAYRRGVLFAKRRRMMDDWAAFCSRLEAPEGEIVPMRLAQ